MANSSIVIKVNCEERLHRFSASIHNQKLDLNYDTLREKVRSIFRIRSECKFTLTYVDQDGDTVTLANDDDLDEAVRQSLNPLRITVKIIPSLHSRMLTMTPKQRLEELQRLPHQPLYA